MLERTLLADPGKGDVNLFIARCRLANNDLEGGVEACRQMFAWEDRHPRNLNRKEGAAEVRLISESDRAELEQLLVQVARLELSTKELDTAKLAAETLVEEVDRCKHLPLLARILADSGEAKQAIQFGEEANNGCGRTALSAESFFAQAKAHCLLGEATPAARILTALLSDKKVAGVFVDLIRSDAAFDILKGTDAYQAFLAADSPSGTSIEKSNPPVPPDPSTTPIQDGENSESQDGIPRPPG